MSASANQELNSHHESDSGSELERQNCSRTRNRGDDAGDPRRCSFDALQQDHPDYFELHPKYEIKRSQLTIAEVFNFN